LPWCCWWWDWFCVVHCAPFSLPPSDWMMRWWWLPACCVCHTHTFFYQNNESHYIYIHTHIHKNTAHITSIKPCAAPPVFSSWCLPKRQAQEPSSSPRQHHTHTHTLTHTPASTRAVGPRSPCPGKSLWSCSSLPPPPWHNDRCYFRYVCVCVCVYVCTYVGRRKEK
jgi:hypothetical protein